MQSRCTRLVYISTLVLVCTARMSLGYTIIGQDDARASSQKKPWTFIVYLAADNNLYPFIEDDINEMQKVGTNEHINVLAYVNTRLPKQKKTTRRLVVHQGETFQVGPDAKRNSGDPDTLIDALIWAHTNFPSEHTAVVLWDHGSGSLNRFLGATVSPLRWWHRNYAVTVKIMSEEQLTEVAPPAPMIDRGICYDDTTGSFFTDANLQSALAYMCKKYRENKPYDVLAFDACLMADIETAYAVRPYVQYMVASQQTIPGTGYGYDYVLRAASQQALDPRSFAVSMTQAYHEEYTRQTGNYTLSALDMASFDALVANVNTVADLLLSHLKGPNRSRIQRTLHLSSNPWCCTHFDEPAYIDLGHLYTNLINNMVFMRLKVPDREQLLTALTQGLTLLDTCVIANAKGKNFPRASGLSIYCDQNRVDTSYKSLIWSHEAHWYPMLKEFVG